MKETLQNFGSKLFCHQYLQYIICNLAGFRNCLVEYTVHSRSCHCYGLLTASVVLNSVARWGNTARFFTKML